MEMLDVLRRLKEIAETKPELVKDAVENVERTNPKEVNENPALMALGRVAAKSAGAAAGSTAVNRIADKVLGKQNEGGMSDIHIGAEEAVGEYVNDDGNLRFPKAQVIADLMKKSKESEMPASYEYQEAARMVADDFADNGSRRHGIDEPEGIDDFGGQESTELNTNTMENKDKETVKEAVQISTDSPEEAGMMMQILKLAGVQPVDAAMINQEPEAEENPAHGEPGHVCGDEDDAMGSNDMAKMRDVITKPDEEKAEEHFANSPGDREKHEPKTMDVDTLVNVHSGGLNRQKQQVRKEYPGDNPLAVEDRISEEDLANSLRTQYEGFKQAYQEAAKVAETKAKPDFIDLDKDGNKTEPMKKAADDKEAK